MIQIVIVAIISLLIILFLSYDPARRLLISSLTSIIAIWLTLLILAAFIAAFIFFGNLGWKYMKPTFHDLSISMNHKLQRLLILFKHGKGAWIIYSVAILSIIAFILLIIFFGKKIEKRSDKTK
jgi:TRAP-type C4-dicarboxylate transport system permease small subunit